ncbi:PREDICTED: neprilysin-1-like isoform X2 [Acromyrmex echinatior]|uniref:neprilysin-1-like isoform X2 n=1 Tax=Acromyrmex echinatior TaxID=103372 RepID=UPI000580D0D7|nr:PREDICTED: neprilysin-1-like isoform X2 [Acromyrmex echinatior]
MVHVERSAHQGTWVCCVPCYWLRRSKAVHKALLTFAMMLVTSLLVTSPVLFLITTLPEGEQPRKCAPLDEACVRERDGPEGVCDTDVCVEASKRILTSMKRGVDPCKDFYKFACGGFRDQQPYQPSASFNILQAQIDERIHKTLTNETGQMIVAFEKLGQFYDTCRDFKKKPVNFTPVYELLNKFGGYLSPKSVVPTDITPLISALLKVNGAPFFDLYVDIDLYDRTKSSVYLDFPVKHQNYKFLAEDQKNRDVQRSRRIREIVQGFLPKNMDPEERSSETDLLLQFCLSLEKHKDLYNWVDVEQRVYVAYNVTYLQENFGYIRWRSLLNATLPYRVNGVDLNGGNNDTNSVQRPPTYVASEDQQIYVYITAPRYFRSLGKLLSRSSRRIIHNGLLLLYADTLHDIINVTAVKDWEDSCYRLTKSIFSEAVSVLYVRQYTPKYLETLVNRVTALFERVKETIAERILVKSWLDDETRTQALQKLNSLQGRFHVSPDFYNDSLLTREMAEVVIDSDDFITTVLNRFRQLQRSKDQSPLRKNAIMRNHYPYSVNAYYESSTNTIEIPLAMMTSWAWSWDGGPAFAVHATLGSVIAHEILHAFDFHRRKLPMESDRNIDEWLRVTADSWKRLETKIECVARLYARSFWRKVQSYGNDVAVQFDWNMTKNENVADIGALQIAHKTWHILTNGKDRSLPGLEGLRPSQLFFISAAQVYCVNTTLEAYVFSVEFDYHASHPERVNSVMMNSQAFVEAFRCPLGTKMNPPNKCTVW